MKVLRVLQLGMTDNLGGIETYLMNYYRNIDKTKIQFDFINIYDKPLCFDEEIKKLGGKIYKVSSYYRKPIKYLKEVKRIINENSYTIIHCNMNSAAMIFPLIAAKISKAKVIISHSHNSSSDKGWVKSLLHNINKRFIPLLANRYFACSDKAGKWFFNSSIINSDNFRIIYNAVDIDNYKYNKDYRREIRKELKISDNKIVIGHVGRFNKQKNHDFFIECFEELYKKNNNYLLLLVGDGPLLDKEKQLVKKLQLENSVLFLGRRSDINKIYNAMDLFVLPSLYEGLPLVGVEAQINGLNAFFSEEVTREVKLSPKTLFLPLENEKWVESILNADNIRNNNDKSCKKFDIVSNASQLEKIYMEEALNNGKD